METTETMDNKEKLNLALKLVKELCSKCSFCTPHCNIYKAQKALEALKYDWENYKEME